MMKATKATRVFPRSARMYHDIQNKSAVPEKGMQTTFTHSVLLPYVSEVRNAGRALLEGPGTQQ